VKNADLFVSFLLARRPERCYNSRMHRPSQEEIQERLRQHSLWLAGEEGGECFSAHNENLSGVDLSGVVLSGVVLSGADLRSAVLPAPTNLLLVQWGVLPPVLCAQAMRFDAASHPNPGAFALWADRGRCPYENAKFGRAVNFRENPAHWDPTTPLLRPWDLMVNLIRSVCADSDFHIAAR
jgi:hypothetical protein